MAADAQSSSVPRRLLCNRLEVLIHLTLLRVTWGAGSEGEETASKMIKKKKKNSDNGSADQASLKCTRYQTCNSDDDDDDDDLWMKVTKLVYAVRLSAWVKLKPAFGNISLV